MSIAIPTLHSRQTDPRSLSPSDLAVAIAVTATLIIATVVTAAVGPMLRTGAAIVDLGLLGLAGRRVRALPAAVATVVVVITSVLTAPEAVKAPVLVAVALTAYSVVRYESGARLVSGILVCTAGVGIARLVLPPDRAHGVTIAQLEVVLVFFPVLTAALIRVRGRLPGLLGPRLYGSGPLSPESLDSIGQDVTDLGVADGHHPTPAGGLHRVVAWLEFGRAHRDRLLTLIAAGLVMLVLMLHGASTGMILRDVTVVGLAVIAVASVAMVGRWPWPALLVGLGAAVSFAGLASLPDTYNSVIGGVVVIGLPLMVGWMLQLRSAAAALGACLSAIVVMGLVARSSAIAVIGGSTPGGSEVLSSAALAVGAWSAGRVIRSGCQVAWAGARPALRRTTVEHTVDRAEQLPADPENLRHRAGLLGLRPTTIQIDKLRAGEVVPPPVREVLGLVLDEALTNAARHAPGSELTITVLRDQATLRIEVINGPAADPSGARSAPGGPGRGVPALAARIATLGGMFAVGPHSDGFVLRASLPLADALQFDGCQLAGRDLGDGDFSDGGAATPGR